MINRISRYSYYKETKDNGDYVVDPDTGEAITRFPLPWPHFKDELEIRLTQDAAKLRKQLFDVNYDSYAEIDLDTVKPPFVSRMSNHKVTGEAHEATVRSGKLADEGKMVRKVPLTELKLDKNGNIENYYAPNSDRLLYEALKERLLAFGGDGQKAFTDGEFHKPKSDGTPGSVVKKVKVTQYSSRMVEVQDHTGVSRGGDMVRCDVFFVEGDGYYFVPVYVSDTVKEQLPMYAPTRGDDNGVQIMKKMDDSNFIFSLYKNDLVKLYGKKKIKLSLPKKLVPNSSLASEIEIAGEEGIFLYYSTFDRNTTKITGVVHDGTYQFCSSCKTVPKIEKYEVDVLGNVRKVGKEKRQTFDRRKK